MVATKKTVVMQTVKMQRKLIQSALKIYSIQTYCYLESLLL